MEIELKLQEVIALLENQKIQQKTYLTFQEALAYLNVSKSFLYKLTSGNSITFLKPRGKLIYFRRSDLEDWISQNEIKSFKTSEEETNNYLNKSSDGEI